VDQILGKFSF